MLQQEVDGPRAQVEPEIVEPEEFGAELKSVYIRHFRRVNPFTQATHPKGGCTVVIVKGPDGKLAMGTSFCSFKDSYSKLKGRLLARSRAVTAYYSGRPLITSGREDGQDLLALQEIPHKLLVALFK